MDNQPTAAKKPMITFDKKEMMYGLIVIFLLFIMYYLGQISTHNIYEDVSRMTNCSVYQISSVSPFGVNLVKNFKMNNSFPFVNYNQSVTNQTPTI